MSEPIITTAQHLALCNRHIARVKALRDARSLPTQRIAHRSLMRKIAVMIRMHLRAAGIEIDPHKLR